MTTIFYDFIADDKKVRRMIVCTPILPIRKHSILSSPLGGFRLCPKLCVHMPLRKCTSLFSWRCYATFGSAVRRLIDAFHPAGLYVHFLRFIFYKLGWM